MKKNGIIAVYPGSFDPLTYGHLDIIRRAAKLFDKLVVAVLNNSSKNPFFSVEERIDMLRRASEDLPNLQIDYFQGLLVQYMSKNDIPIIVRGLRAVTDFEYEMQIATTNRKIQIGIETLFMASIPEFSYLSSSLVKEIAKYGGNVSHMVPELVEKEIFKKLSSQ